MSRLSLASRAIVAPTVSVGEQAVVDLDVDLVLDQVLQHVTLERSVHPFLVQLRQQLLVLALLLGRQQPLATRPHAAAAYRALYSSPWRHDDTQSLHCLYGTRPSVRPSISLLSIRPIVRPVIRPSVRLSVPLSICPSIRLFVCPLSVCPSLLRPSVCQSVCTSVCHPAVRRSVGPSVHPSVRRVIHPSSVRPPVRLLVHPSYACPSIHLTYLYFIIICNF